MTSVRELPGRVAVVDVETTGLHAERGDRIIEIGVVELVDRRRTGRVFHRYLNPGRKVDAEALRVHGISDAFLTDKPAFADIVEELAGFLRDAELVIHNAEFDLGFLHMECARIGRDPLTGPATIVHDTLISARREALGKRHSLDALCARYGVDNKKRELHGALLDAELLADVYVAMTRDQRDLVAGIETTVLAAPEVAREPAAAVTVDNILVLHADEAEAAAHDLYLSALAAELRADPVWGRSAQA